MITLSIPDMTCGHCQASVEQALGRIAGVTAVTVDLAHRSATVSGAADPVALIEVLHQIGFPATKAA